MGKTVGEILDGMDADELTEWVAFARVEPFEGYRADIRAAGIQAVLANCHRDSQTKPFDVADFLPDYFGEHQQAKTEKTDFKTQMMAWVLSSGGKVQHGRRSDNDSER